MPSPRTRLFDAMNISIFTLEIANKSSSSFIGPDSDVKFGSLQEDINKLQIREAENLDELISLAWRLEMKRLTDEEIKLFKKIVRITSKLFQWEEKIEEEISPQLLETINVYIRALYAHMDSEWQALDDIEEKVPFYKFSQNLLTGKLFSIFGFGLQHIEGTFRSSAPNADVYNKLDNDNCVVSSRKFTYSGLRYNNVKLKKFHTDRDCQCLQVPVVDFPIQLESSFVSYVINTYLAPLLRISGWIFTPEVKLATVDGHYLRTDLQIQLGDKKSFIEYKMEPLNDFYKDGKNTHSAVMTQVLGCMVGTKTDTCFIVTTSAIIQFKLKEFERSVFGVMPVFEIDNYNYREGDVSGLTYLFLKLQDFELKPLNPEQYRLLKEAVVRQNV